MTEAVRRNFISGGKWMGGYSRATLDKVRYNPSPWSNATRPATIYLGMDAAYLQSQKQNL